MEKRLVPILLASACLAWGSAAEAAHLSILYNFAPGGTGADARNPYAGLARDAAGNLYGAAYAGGSAGDGAIFMLSPPAHRRGRWSETIIHSFSAATDGANPLGGVILGEAGIVYGTTSTGGTISGAGVPPGPGAGTVFALHPPAQTGGAWTETVIAVLPAGRGAPAATLLQDESGALYGTTSQGGAGYGSVFQLKPSVAPSGPWLHTDLYAFTGGADGQSPQSALAAGPDGALYGTTAYSGGKSGTGGTVFRLAPPRTAQGVWAETTLFDFPGTGAYGSLPNGSLVLDQTGHLTGTASAGGAHGAGTVFRLAPPAGGNTAWTCNVLYHFTGRLGDGFPQGGITIGPAGTLIGTTASLDRHQQGAVYQLIPGTDAAQNWSETVLARFPVRPAGGGLFPVGDLTGTTAGTYIGVTETGGTGGAGTVFEIVP